MPESDYSSTIRYKNSNENQSTDRTHYFVTVLASRRVVRRVPKRLFRIRSIPTNSLNNRVSVHQDVERINRERFYIYLRIHTRISRNLIREDFNHFKISTFRPRVKHVHSHLVSHNSYAHIRRPVDVLRIRRSNCLGTLKTSAPRRASRCRLKLYFELFIDKPSY